MKGFICFILLVVAITYCAITFISFPQEEGNKDNARASSSLMYIDTHIQRNLE